MKTETIKASGAGAGLSAVIVQVINEFFGYFESGRIAAQQAAGNESYLALLSTLAENCR